MTDVKPSKSARKREQQALQELGERLVTLPDPVLAELELGERVLEAVAELRRMKSHEAIRRQKQYLGKLMRDVDPAPAQAYFAALASSDQRERRIFRQAERWRDRLLDEGPNAIPVLAAETGADCNAIESLLHDIATTHGERQERHLRRELFREIHAMLVARTADG